MPLNSNHQPSNWVTQKASNVEKSAPFVSKGFIMAALWNRAGHYIFMLWFLSSSIYLSFFFLA